ncbi:MAG: hypothetical protein KDD19_03310 [Phaeodactylibacter sp.]|nr:hypothetical protein [Phaeodactylibacter sp.]MCB9052229.1 hypothetical protein [Lewinellaceae bacterium]
MIDKFKRAIQDASEVLREQAANLGEGAKEKTYQLIEEWLQVFPKLEIYGLEITSFSLAVALSPALEVELKGSHEKFSKERLDEIVHEVRKSPALSSVFTTIRTTYSLHRRTYASLSDPLIVRIRIRLSPEIKVYIGKPVIE